MNLRFLALPLMVAVLAFGMAGCESSGASDSSNDTDGSSSTSSPDPSPGTSLPYADVTVDPNRVETQSERDAIELYKSWFPASSAIPPIIADGILPGWQNISTTEFQRYVFTSEVVPQLTDPHFFQISVQAADYNNSLTDLLVSVENITGLDDIVLDNIVEVEGWRAIFGQTLNASYNRSTIQGQEVVYFIDTLGPDFSDTVIINVIYARPVVFNGWDGILLPLVHNGYIRDPNSFGSRAVFIDATDDQLTAFYAAMINTRLQSEYTTLITLSEGAQQAVQNAVTISSCASASNCSISYVNGVAVADYN